MSPSVRALTVARVDAVADVAVLARAVEAALNRDLTSENSYSESHIAVRAGGVLVAGVLETQVEICRKKFVPGGTRRRRRTTETRPG